ncbi:MAG: sigma-70 family RNA polymerase sigma factor [Saprospiraceae bacterium]|nr:sigma-70 family RNA polymerase sigma factor [Saprospiraceae bacterium]
MRTPISNLSDDTVIDTVLSGNTDQFEELLKRYNNVLFRIGISYLKDPTDTEDAMQSTYLKAYLHLASFNKSSSFKTWIIRIMINECKMMLRSKRSAWNLLQVFRRNPNRPNLMHSVEHTVIAGEIKQVFESAILQLPKKYRVVYMMREINGLSVSESASVLGLSPENVKVRLHRAKELIKKRIMELNQNEQLFDYHLDRCTLFRNRVMAEIKKRESTTR